MNSNTATQVGSPTAGEKALLSSTARALVGSENKFGLPFAKRLMMYLVDCGGRRSGKNVVVVKGYVFTFRKSKALISVTGTEPGHYTETPTEVTCRAIIPHVIHL